jgi:hypothetical protein
MEKVTFKVVIKTKDKDETSRAISKYLKETLKDYFLEKGEKIESVEILDEE